MARTKKSESKISHVADLTGSLAGMLVALSSSPAIRELTSEERWSLYELLEKDFSFYGRGRIDEVSEGVLLKDGSWLVCMSTTSFRGTFASHDDFKVAWYQVWFNT